MSATTPPAAAAEARPPESVARAYATLLDAKLKMLLLFGRLFTPTGSASRGCVPR
jgi:hypothetical protein